MVTFTGRRLRVFAACLSGVLAGGGTANAAVLQTGETAKMVRKYLDSHEQQIVAEFARFLALPNDSLNGADIRRNAEAIVQMLASRNIAAKLLESDGTPPVVMAEIITPAATQTVTFYAHYDGQPVDPIQWASPPFSPVLRDRPVEIGGGELPLEHLPDRLDPQWRLYGRSAGDDKAAIIALLTALDALQAARMSPTINIRLFFEGEEERGSPHLAHILERYRADLATAAWLVCDGPVHPSGRMQVFFGARGFSAVDITIYGANRPLHSGLYGNWAPNPTVLLAHLIASMRDTESRVLIPGFYDSVRPISRAEKAAISNMPDEDTSLRHALGFARSEAMPAALARQVLQPALNVRGFEGGHVGDDAANVIDAQATASIDFRLVPDQTPEAIQAVVERHVRTHGFFVTHADPSPAQREEHPHIAKLSWRAGYPGSRTSLQLPISQAVIAAVESARGPSVHIPAVGGSVPLYLFEKITHSPAIGVPIANYDDNQHAANENLRLQNLWDGIELFATLFTDLGVNDRRASTSAPPLH